MQKLSAVLRVVSLCVAIGLPLVITARLARETYRRVDDIGREVAVESAFAMRTFHYAKPHPPFEPKNLTNGMVLTFCPECEDLRRQAACDEPLKWLPLSRYEELLSVEASMETP